MEEQLAWDKIAKQYNINNRRTDKNVFFRVSFYMNCFDIDDRTIAKILGKDRTTVIHYHKIHENVKYLKKYKEIDNLVKLNLRDDLRRGSGEGG